jgi:hypothetical protein
MGFVEIEALPFAGTSHIAIASFAKASLILHFSHPIPIGAGVRTVKPSKTNLRLLDSKPLL